MYMWNALNAWRARTKRGNVLTNALLGVIAVAAVVGITILAMRSPGSGSSGMEKGPKPAILKSGQKMTADAAKQEGLNPTEPKESLDRNRILQSYPPGRKYRMVLKAAVQTKASAKDWGVEEVLNLNYAAECEMVRTIESNDGQTLLETRDFRKCRNVAVFCEIEDVRINLGTGGQLILGALDMYGGTPGVWSSFDGLSAKPVLDLIPGLGDVSGQAKKLFAHVDTLEGKKVRITYVNGKGVTQIEPLSCELSRDELGLLFDLASLSDAYLLPNVNCKVGDTWAVSAADLLPIFDPSLRSNLSGQIVVRRVRDEGTNDSPVAVVAMDEGVVQLRDVESGNETVGQWAPRGELRYSFGDQMVTGGDLTGAVSIDRHSTDHILFEARTTMRPDYKVVYSCELLK